MTNRLVKWWPEVKVTCHYALSHLSDYLHTMSCLFVYSVTAHCVDDGCLNLTLAKSLEASPLPPLPLSASSPQDAFPFCTDNRTTSYTHSHIVRGAKCWRTSWAVKCPRCGVPFLLPLPILSLLLLSTFSPFFPPSKEH